MATFEREVKSLLRGAGWSKDRQGRSSHEQWKHSDHPTGDHCSEYDKEPTHRQ